MSKINYKSEFFSLLNDLTTINKSIIIDCDENISIKRSDPDESIAYILEVSKDYFDLNTDKIAFYNYMEFYQFFNTMDSPDLSIKDNKIILTKGKTKINYLLSNPESIKAGPRKINFSNVDFGFNLDTSTIDELNKMHSLIKAKRCVFTTDKDEITLKIFNNDKDNSFEKVLPLDRISDCSDELDFKIFSETITKIPSKRNYRVSIKNPGYLEFALIDDDINLKIYSALTK
ncbi:MAG: hypothetical protein WC260_01650 [Candidatus Pacearchaeota archaeon]